MSQTRFHPFATICCVVMGSCIINSNVINASRVISYAPLTIGVLFVFGVIRLRSH